MDYQEFVSGQFIPQVQAILAGLRDNLVIAGVKANTITIAEVTTEGVNDLRYRITAVRGNKTLQAYIELTAGPIVNGAMTLIVTLWVEGNGGQITTSYTSNAPVPYNDETALDGLLAKLTQLDNVSKGELLTAARAFLQV